MSELRAYDPTWRDRLAQMLMGDGHASPERRRLVEGLVGSSGLGRSGASLADFTPAGNAFSAQEAKRAYEDGNYVGAGIDAIGAVPIPLVSQAVKKAGGLLRPDVSMASRSVSMYNPPAKPLRAFELDYPKGAPVDEAGKLTHTIDGAPITARYVVGRAEAGGSDVALPREALDEITTALTGKGVVGAPPSDLGKASGRYFKDRLSPDEWEALKPWERDASDGFKRLLAFNKDLSDDAAQRVAQHEVGHLLDDVAGKSNAARHGPVTFGAIPQGGLKKEIGRVYNDVNTSPLDPRLLRQERTGELMPQKFWVTPESQGYKAADAPAEYMAEAIRAYAEDPNYLKTVAPATAAAVRKAVNTNPKINHVLQFNSVTPVLAGGGAAALALGVDGEAKAADMKERGPWDDYAPTNDAPPKRGGPWDDYAPMDIPTPPPGVVIHQGNGTSVVTGRPDLTIDRSKVAGTPQEEVMLEAQRRRAAFGPDSMAQRLMPFGQGLGFNFTDEVASAGAAPINAMRSGNSVGQEFAIAQEQQRQMLDAERGARPVQSTLGEIGGGLTTGLGAMANGLTLMRAGMGLPKLMAAGAAEGAGYGALYGAGAAKDGERLSGATEGAGYGAAIGGAIPAVARGLGGAISRAISPTTISPERQAAINILQAEGVPTTAGQKSGSKALQYAESFLGDAPLAGGKATKAMQDQAEAFTDAAMRRIGGAGRATPENMADNYRRIGQEFSDLSGRNTLKTDPQFAQDIANAVVNYDKVLTAEQKPVVGNMLQDLIARIDAGRGTLPGSDYQTIRSRLTKRAQNARGSDNELADVYRGVRDSLDGAMSRSIAPEDAAAWSEARRQYGNYKTLEKAVGGAGANNAEGLISPQALRTAIASGKSKGQYVRGDGDFAELARAGNLLMAPLPNSGTAQRNMLTGITSGGGALAGGIPGMLAAVGAPAAAGRAIMSGPGQAYLSNQAMSPLARALLERSVRAGMMGGAEAEGNYLLRAR